jgi:hypothetical protein
MRRLTWRQVVCEPVLVAGGESDCWGWEPDLWGWWAWPLRLVTLRLETKEDKMGIKMTGKNREKSWCGWFRHIIMLSLAVTQIYQAAELEMDMHSSHTHVPNTLEIGCPTWCRLLYFSNSILSGYYNLVHLSPLAFILLLLEFFFLGLLCLFRW